MSIRDSMLLRRWINQINDVVLKFYQILQNSFFFNKWRKYLYIKDLLQTEVTNELNVT